MESVDELTKVAIYFTLLLAVSLLIERVLEVAKAVYDFLDAQYSWHKRWTGRTRRIAHLLHQRVDAFRYSDSNLARSVLRRVDEIFLTSDGDYNGKVIMLSADAVRANGIRMGAKVLGVLLGILFAFWLQVDLIDLYQNAVDDNPFEKFFHILVSGIALGLGAAPMHKVITALERKQKDRAKAKRQARAG